MLYHLFQYLDRSYDLPGAGMFQYISFRSALAVILALLITITFGQGIIRFMQRRQIGEEIRNLGLEGQLQKRGTPTMGGVMILLAVLVPVLLFGRLDNIYIQLMIVSTVWLGLLGFLDDYIKVFRHNKEGLKGKFKIVGQVGIGIIVGTVMCASPEVVVRDKVVEPVQQLFVDDDGEVIESVTTNRVVMGTESVKTTQTTIPFVKNNEFDYAWFTGGNRVATWILYVLVAIFVVTAVSNGANLTDGLDGLVTGVSVPIVAVLGVLAAGAAYVPVGVSQPEARAALILEQAGASLCVDSTELARLEAADPLPAPAGPSERALAYVIYTSGSTGVPKGVAVSHAAAWNTIADVVRRWGMGPGDAVLGVSALDFDLSVFDIFGALSFGAAVVTRRSAATHRRGASSSRPGA